ACRTRPPDAREGAALPDVVHARQGTRELPLPAPRDGGATRGPRPLPRRRAPRRDRPPPRVGRRGGALAAGAAVDAERGRLGRRARRERELPPREVPALRRLRLSGGAARGALRAASGDEPSRPARGPRDAPLRRVVPAAGR